jgi:hypothetical protein
VVTAAPYPRLCAAVVRVAHQSHVWIALGEALHNVAGFVAGAVVHDHDLESLDHFGQDRAGRTQGVFDVLRLVVGGHAHRQERRVRERDSWVMRLHRIGGLARLQPEDLGDPVVGDQSPAEEDIPQASPSAALVLQARPHVFAANSDQHCHLAE